MNKILLFVSIFLFSYSALADLYEDLARATGGTVSTLTKEKFIKNVGDGKFHYDSLKNAALVTMQTFQVSGLNNFKISFPVDSQSFGSMAVEFFGANSDLVILNLTEPNGKKVIPNIDSGELTSPFQITQLKHKAIIVPNPKIGIWTAEVQGPAEGKIIVRLQSKISLLKARFVEMSGRPGHQGLFPIVGNPKAGTSAIFQLEMDGVKYESTTIHLVDEAGNNIGAKVQISENDGVAHVKIDIPNTPFRIVVKNKEFQRVVENLFNSK